MIDWYQQVFSVISQLSEKTFHISVQIMDKFLSSLHHDKVVFPHNYLYLLGITSIFIASKYEEVQCIPLDIIVDELGHKRHKADEVLMMELRILQVINFRIPQNCVYEDALTTLVQMQAPHDEKLE